MTISFTIAQDPGAYELKWTERQNDIDVAAG